MAQGRETERKLNFEGTVYQVRCLNCGKTFSAQRADATYCTLRCRKQASRAAHADQEAIRELRIMAYRVENLSKTFSGNQAVLDQVQLLAASIKSSMGNFSTAWEVQPLPGFDE